VCPGDFTVDRQLAEGNSRKSWSQYFSFKAHSVRGALKKGVLIEDILCTAHWSTDPTFIMPHTSE